MSARKVSSYAGSRSSSHSRLDLLAEVAIGEAETQGSSWREDEGESSSLGESAELPARDLQQLKHSCWDVDDLPVPACKKRRTPKERVNFEADLAIARSASNSGIDCVQSTMDESAGQGETRRKQDRLSWNGKLQERFLNAVRFLGLKDAVPKEILRLMAVDGLTREQVASHLQKYRQSLKKGIAARRLGAQELEAAQQRYMPGLPAIGVPCDLQMPAALSSRGPATNGFQVVSPWSACSLYPANTLHSGIPVKGVQPHPAARASSPEDPAFNRIREYNAQKEAAMTAEFLYPPGPPVFIPPTNSSSTALTLLDIQPLNMPQQAPVKDDGINQAKLDPLFNLLEGASVWKGTTAAQVSN